MYLEIFRAGIQSIDKGQNGGRRSLWFNLDKTMCYIIMPQALKQLLFLR